MAANPRGRYVPLLIRWAGGNTYHKLYDKFGYAGLVVWTNYLIACKRNDPEGRLQYTSEGDGWHKLALFEMQPEFTLSAFFTFTGHLKKTRRTRVGHATHVVCTHWEDHNKAWKTQQAAEQKARKRQETKPDTERTEPGQPPDNVRLARAEVEAEAEEEVRETAEQSLPQKPRDPHNPEPTALLDRSIGLHTIGAELERRLGTVAPPDTAEAILALIPQSHQDQHTPETIRRAIEPLHLYQREQLHDELLNADTGIRNLAKYAVKIAQRIAAGTSNGHTEPS